MWVKTNHYIFAVCMRHFNPAGGISVVSSLPKNVHTGRSITLFAQHNTFMAPIIKEIRTAKPKRLL